MVAAWPEAQYDGCIGTRLSVLVPWACEFCSSGLLRSSSLYSRYICIMHFIILYEDRIANAPKYR